MSAHPDDRTATEPLLLPLCPVLLTDATLCLRPLGDDTCVCAHRAPGPAPDAVAGLVTELRRQVEEARTVASTIAAAMRCWHGDRGVASVLGHREPRWMRDLDPRWPPQ